MVVSFTNPLASLSSEAGNLSRSMVAPFPFSGVKISEDLARDETSKHPIKVTPG